MADRTRLPPSETVRTGMPQHGVSAHLQRQEPTRRGNGDAKAHRLNRLGGHMGVPRKQGQERTHTAFVRCLNEAPVAARSQRRVQSTLSTELHAKQKQTCNPSYVPPGRRHTADLGHSACGIRVQLNGKIENHVHKAEVHEGIATQTRVRVQCTALGKITHVAAQSRETLHTPSS